MTTLAPVIELSATAIPALTRSYQAAWARLATRRHASGGAERGSVTIEQVLWAVAVIAIVGIVVAAIRAYVTTQVGNIN